MNHPSRFDLDRVASGEADVEVENHLAVCRVCCSYVDTLKGERQALIKSKPADLFMRQVIARSTTQQPEGQIITNKLRPALVFTGACAVLLLTFLFVGARILNGTSDKEDGSADSGHGMRWMGGHASVKIFVNRAGSVFELNGRSARPGDSLQFRIALPGRDHAYATVIGIEDGKPMPVLPASAKDGPYEIDGAGMLPQAIEIDDNTTSLQLLIFVRSNRFQIDQVLAEVSGRLASGKTMANIDGLADLLTVGQGI